MQTPQASELLMLHLLPWHCPLTMQGPPSGTCPGGGVHVSDQCSSSMYWAHDNRLNALAQSTILFGVSLTPEAVRRETQPSFALSRHVGRSFQNPTKPGPQRSSAAQ